MINSHFKTKLCLVAMLFLSISCEKSEMDENSEWASMEAVSHLISEPISRNQKPEKHKLFAGIGYSPIISHDGLSIKNRFFQFKNHFYLSIGLNL